MSEAKKDESDLSALLGARNDMKRYKISCPDCDPYLEQSREGDWVRYTDVVEVIRAKEQRELEAAAEADEYKAALQDARAIIQKAVDAAQSLAPFVLAHSKWGA